MSVKLTVSNKNGMMLYTKKTYVEDDIQLVLDEELFPSGTVVITENGTHDVEKYTTAEINVDSRKPEQSKEVEYNENGQYIVLPEEGHVLTDVKVAVNVPIPEGYVKPEGAVELNANGEYDIYDKAVAKINVPIPEGYLKPEGNINITNTAEIDVTEFAKAQIVDENLKPENIAEDITVLGIKGTFRGGVDTSDATITPDKVLKDEIGYANDERIVGTIETYNYTTKEGIVPEIDAFIERTLTEYKNNRITKIGDRAIQGYVSLTSYEFNNVETIGSYAFYGCTGITEIDFPKATSIAGNAFNECPNVVIAKLPSLMNLLTDITRGLSNLKIAYIPNVQSIGGAPFADCSSIEAVIITQTNKVATLATTNVFVRSGVANGTGYVYVPDELVEDYKKATNWSTFAMQIRGLSQLPQEIKEVLR